MIRVVHISYKKITESDPEKWLRRINFYCGILEEMAKKCEVWSIHSIDHDGQLTKNGVHYQFINRPFADGVITSKVNDQVMKLNPDVVVIHGLGFPWDVLLLQRSLPPSVRLFIQNHAERPFRSHKGLLQKLVDKKTRGYFFASSDLASPWIERGQIGSAGKIHEVMEVSSVFAPMDRALAQQKAGANGEANYLWVGRLNENKNPLLVVRAFLEFLDQRPEATLFLIYQEDDLLKDIKTILSTSGEKRERVILVGRVEHSEMTYWYNSIDFILSSSYYEGSGVAICEAMSCGCFPVLTDIASFRMMTDNGRVGFLYHPNDQTALVNALRNTISVKVDARARIIDWFKDKLSFQAISNAMFAAMTRQ
jgi:glycosyltransferase involved in cell wall biosynthesis